VPQILRLPWRSAVSPSVPRLNRSALVGLEPQRRALASLEPQRSALVGFEPQRSALVLVLVLSQVYYDHLGFGLELPWRSAWSQAPLEVRGLPFFFTNLSFPAQSCTSLPIDHLDIGLLHPTAQPLCSFVALASAGSPIVCAGSSLGLPASCIAGTSNVFHRWVCQLLSRGNSATAFAVAAALGIHSSTVLLPPPQENAKGIITSEDPRPHGHRMLLTYFLVLYFPPKRQCQK
jgi:hypothetical protein